MLLGHMTIVSFPALLKKKTNFFLIFFYWFRDYQYILSSKRLMKTEKHNKVWSHMTIIPFPRKLYLVGAYSTVSCLFFFFRKFEMIIYSLWNGFCMIQRTRLRSTRLSTLMREEKKAYVWTFGSVNNTMKYIAHQSSKIWSYLQKYYTNNGILCVKCAETLLSGGDKRVRIGGNPKNCYAVFSTATNQWGGRGGAWLEFIFVYFLHVSEHIDHFKQ